MSDQATASATNAGSSPIVGKASTTRSPIEAHELLRADAGDVRATTVTMDRSGAERIEAERVVMERSGARSLDARSAQLDRSGVVVLKSERAVLHDASAVAVVAQEARLVKSRVGAIISKQTTVEGNVTALLHVGPACDGVRPVLDGAGAIRFGAAFGVAVLLLGRLLRRIV